MTNALIARLLDLSARIRAFWRTLTRPASADFAVDLSSPMELGREQKMRVKEARSETDFAESHQWLRF
jgi:hypothetical protein